MSNPKKNFGTSSTTPSSFSMPWQRSSSEIELTSKSGNNSETYPNYNVPNIQSQGQPGSSASRGSYKSNKYKGWKLSIPVPTYFSPREEYDSQCIEMYGGYYERDQDSSSSPSHTKYDSSFLPFVKLPRSIHDTFSTSRSSVSASKIQYSMTYNADIQFFNFLLLSFILSSTNNHFHKLQKQKNRRKQAIQEQQEQQQLLHGPIQRHI